MLEPGGLNDQPDQLMRCFKILDSAKTNIDNDNKEKEAAKRRRQAVKSAGATSKGRPRRRR